MFVGVNAREGINVGLQALLAVSLCFGTLILFTIIVNLIYWHYGRKKHPKILVELNTANAVM